MKVHVSRHVVHLPPYCHPGVFRPIVLGKLRMADGYDAAPGAGQIGARVAQPDPVHQRMARLQCGFVPRVA